MAKLEKFFSPFLTFGEPQLERIKAAAIDFARDMISQKQPRWLTLVGTSGAGKTMLAKKISYIFRSVIHGSIESRSETRVVTRRGGFMNWSKLIGYVREGEYRVFEDVKNDWFVALDDIGAEYQSPMAVAKLYEFCNDSERKWRVFTGNLSLGDIEEKLDARIASRMIRHGSIVIDVNVPDFNLRQK